MSSVVFAPAAIRRAFAWAMKSGDVTAKEKGPQATGVVEALLVSKQLENRISPNPSQESDVVLTGVFLLP